MYGERDKIPTGIEDLDKALNGGIPQGNVVLLSGTCGTGKTTISIEFLVHGALAGENSAFISVTEPSVKLLENMRNYEFFDETLIDESKLFFLDLSIVYRKLGLLNDDHTIDDVETLLGSFDNLVRGLDIKRVVVDSVTAICNRLSERSRIRDFVYNLCKTLTSQGATTILISEIGKGMTDYSVYGVEEAVADGIIMLGDIERRGDVVRTLQIIKMRGTDHSRTKYAMELTSTGLVMGPLLKWSEGKEVLR